MEKEKEKEKEIEQIAPGAEIPQNKVDEPQYEKEKVISRLRQAGLVVTYFGETDREREQRWLKFDTESKEDFSYNKGLKNEFDDLMRNLDSNTDEENASKDDLSNDPFLNSPIENIYDGLTLCAEDKALLLFRVCFFQILKDIH